MYVNIPARIPQKPLPVFSNGSSGPLVHGRLIYWVTGVINLFIGVKPSAQEVWLVQMRMFRNLKFRGIDLLREKFNPQSKQMTGDVFYGFYHAPHHFSPPIWEICLSSFPTTEQAKTRTLKDVDPEMKDPH